MENASIRARNQTILKNCMFLIDRAHFYLRQQQFPDAKRDLKEALQMIERSKMNKMDLYEVDYIANAP